MARGDTPASFVRASVETILFKVEDGIATIILNRPEVLNAFDQQMLSELRDVWVHVRTDDSIRVVVVRASGERAFCTGLDVRALGAEGSAWSKVDPLASLTPRRQSVWKPTIVAVHGMCAAGGLLWLAEADVVICSDDATFFDPHLSGGLVSALEPTVLARRIPVGEALRMTLMGSDERLSAERAQLIGLVSEVVPRAELETRARDLAGLIVIYLFDL